MTTRWWPCWLMMIGALLLTGCGSKAKPADEDDTAPGVDWPRGAIMATDRIAEDLLQVIQSHVPNPDGTIGLAVAQWENETFDPRFDRSVFTERLKVFLARRSSGRVEVAGSGESPPATTTAAADAGGAAYLLSGTTTDSQTPESPHLRLQLFLTDAATNEVIWRHTYEVQAAR